MADGKRVKPEQAVRLGVLLKKAREDVGWSPTEAAAHLGMPLATYSNYEYGHRAPRDFIEMLPRFASVLHKSLYYFFGMPEPKGHTAEADTLAAIYDLIENSVLKGLVMQVARANLAIDQENRPVTSPAGRGTETEGRQRSSPGTLQSV